MRLHLGCGDYWIDGAINIDHAVFGGTDMLLDVRERLPFQDGVVQWIGSYDFIEHFTRAEVDVMLTDWSRVLITGGVIEAVVPDIEELLEKKLLHQIYGIEQDHKWGYSVDTLFELFEKHNFRNITVTKEEFSHRPGEPKLKLICQK